MESNWRWNVANLGMSLTSWRLAAWYPRNDPSPHVWLVEQDDPTYWYFYVTAPGQLPTITGVVPKTGPYPGTWNVQPDHGV